MLGVGAVSRTELRESIWQALGTLGYDELRVVSRIIQRLQLGQQVYGVLSIDTDKRNWDDEAREKVLDLAVYAACALERKR